MMNFKKRHDGNGERTVQLIQLDIKELTSYINAYSFSMRALQDLIDLHQKTIRECKEELDQICKHEFKKTEFGYNNDESEWTCQNCGNTTNTCPNWYY
jgi:hypothetical protein